MILLPLSILMFIQKNKKIHLVLYMDYITFLLNGSVQVQQEEENKNKNFID